MWHFMEKSVYDDASAMDKASDDQANKRTLK